MKTNTKAKGPSQLTHEGSHAMRLTPEKELRRSVMANMLFEGEFYENGESIADRIRGLVPKVSPDVVAEIARKARGDMNLRHIPLLLVREMAKIPSHKKLVSQTLYDVIQRPDELTEFLSLYWSENRQPLSAQVKRGLADAFGKFNEYSLAKHQHDDRAIKLRDVLRLCKPKPRDESQAALWKRVINRELQTPDTWEVSLSKGSDKKETFLRLMDEKKLGGLAFLRNLRNMHQAGIEQRVVSEYARTVDLSRILPFRFISAANAVPHWEDTIESMMLRALDGMEKLPGKTALIVDTSPSMWMAKISAKSDMDRFDAAAAIAILIRELCENGAIWTFNEKAYPVPPRRGFGLKDSMAATKGNASYGGKAVEEANKIGYDRIIVITDGQWHVDGARSNGYFGYSSERPAVEACPDPLTNKAYMINVASYKNSVGYGKWIMVDGFSEAVIDYIKMAESPDSFLS